MKEKDILDRSYLVDTNHYWCSDDNYNNRGETFGRFIEDGRAYEITRKDTPRAWLNYLCNERYGANISNTARGYGWYKMLCHSVTKSFDPFNRQDTTGRDIILHEPRSNRTWDLFQEAEDIHCVHRFGYTTICASLNGIKVTLQVFVPLEDSGECWIVAFENLSAESREINVSFEQIWDFVPYIPDDTEALMVGLKPEQLKKIKSRHLPEITTGTNFILAKSEEGLPFPLRRIFVSPQCSSAQYKICKKDGKFNIDLVLCRLTGKIELGPKESVYCNIFSGVEETQEKAEMLGRKYNKAGAFEEEFEKLKEQRGKLTEYPSCQTPSPEIERWLNIWLKNQLYLSFRFNRSHHFGYRDSLQDTWGYTLLEPEVARTFLLRTLSYMKKDGTCPRQYSLVDDQIDWRKYMDSGVWTARTLADYIKETGDFSFLEEKIAWLDSTEKGTVEEHVRAALDLLYRNRGLYGLCLIGEGDWNDSLEGISKNGKAVSVWLTMALFEAQNIMAELYQRIDRQDKADLMRNRSVELKEYVNKHAWDGDWYVYGYTDSGGPIGSKSNREGIIHLNAQTWAVFSGIADKEKTVKIRNSIEKYLETPYGPMLLFPPYITESENVGRMTGLEPGTFENGSIYLHAASFKVMMELAAGNPDAALETILKIMPSNPDNFDCRRTSEPYCLGSFYCGAGHPRFGQNFYSWFTGTVPWLFRIGFDYLLGVKADYDGLRIAPKVPSTWNEFSVRRKFRGIAYDINFIRAASSEEKGIWLDGRKIEGDLIPPQNKNTEGLVKF